MKKLLLVGIVAIMFIVFAPSVLAGAKNATDIEWNWVNPDTGNDGNKSAFFQTTGSGLVNAWTYNHPDMGNAKWVFKPTSKFKNATECDEGRLREKPNWTARGIYSSANANNKEFIKDIFGALDEPYLFCAYPME